jgi:hypothetical protein
MLARSRNLQSWVSFFFCVSRISVRRELISSFLVTALDRPVSLECTMNAPEIRIFTPFADDLRV